MKHRNLIQTWNVILIRLPKLLFSLAAAVTVLIVNQPAYASTSRHETRQQQLALTQRVEQVREQLASHSSDNEQTPERIAQWYNWPNWPNWPNWGNWRNY